MITVSIVIYKNKIEEISKLILSLVSVCRVLKIVIIDNSPTNEFQENILNNEIEYIYNKKNIGFGSAHNIAIRKSIESGAKYHLVLNPDVYFDPKILESLIEFMDANPDVGNVMPKVFYPDGSIQYLCKLLPSPYDWIGRRFNPIKKIVNNRNELFELRFTNYNRIMDVPYLSGCFMFLRVGALKKIGLFDEKIFMYGEETDLCRRLIKGGYRTVFYPNVSIIHEFQKGSHKSWRLTWIGMKSAVYYFNKWGWFFDKERKKINLKTLQTLGYNRKHVR